MKAYLFLLLIGFIFSYNCKNEHISTRIEGRYTKFLFYENCACPVGTTYFIDKTYGRCFCYLKTEIDACLKDSKCQTNLFAGCVNKKTSDYGNK